jgi:stalled ribosome rescue protein Dom34
MHEKKLLESFFEKLGKQHEKTARGYENVKKALTMGAVQILILSKKLDKKIINELTAMAETISANVEIVSTETPEGEQFFNLSGIGAILRYQIE